MKPWQSYARLGVAIAGLACAGVVYATLGSRRTPVPAPPIERIDPSAALETTGGEFQRARDGDLEFDVTAEQSLFYEDGAVRQRDVSIAARNRGGRDFVVTATEASSERNEQALQLVGSVALTASDGFGLTTDRGSFDRGTGVAASPGQVTFHKGGMSGSGVGMTYDQGTDVLQVLDRAAVEVTNPDGSVNFSFSSTRATLDRLALVLRLEGDVRVRRGDEVIRGERAVAVLSEGLDVVTRIELRGRAQVEGGSSEVARMSARDIDLDYGQDGAALEHVALTGNGQIVTGGRNGQGESRIAGETLDVRLGGGGSMEHVQGAGAVSLDQPGRTTAGDRRITAQQIVLGGKPGQGLTDAAFTGDVRYADGVSNRGRTVTSTTLRLTFQDDVVSNAEFGGNVRYAEGVADRGRTVTSARLRLVFLDEAVSNAEFGGRVVFRDAPFEGRAEQVTYRPAAGTLGLSGPDARARPRVEDEHLTVEADTVDVTLAPIQIAARGAVKTTLRPQTASSAPGAGPGDTEPAKLPGLLKQGELANVNAATMTYAAETGLAAYTGDATLWQGDTAIRGDTVVIDQSNGNLTATGSARSSLVLAGERSSGRAHRILYSDAERTIAYLSPPPTVPGAGQGGRATAPAGGGVYLSGAEGELRAERIDVFLNPTAGRAERVEANGFVSSTIGPRSLTGDRLTYDASDERYEVSGSLGAPVRLVESCRETVGRTLIFFKSTDRIIVDGDGRRRTRTEGRGGCAPVANR